MGVDKPLQLRYNNKALARTPRGAKHIGELCKGSTTDSDSVCEGSNPSPAATKTLKLQRLQGFLYMENHWLGQRVKRDYGDRYEKETPYSVYTKASQESILPRKASGNKMPDQAPSFDGASSV